MSPKTSIALHINACLMSYKNPIMWQQLPAILTGKQGLGASPAAIILTYCNGGYIIASAETFLKYVQ